MVSGRMLATHSLTTHHSLFLGTAMRPEISATSPSGNLAIPELVESLLNRAERVVVGQRDNLELVLLALLCGGHILLEGVPGTAKTLMARTLARLPSRRGSIELDHSAHGSWRFYGGAGPRCRQGRTHRIF